MQYLLVENKEIVHLGPIDYRPRFIQSELDELEVECVIPATESGYIKINDSFELFPVGSINCSDYNPLFEFVAGPFWTYKDNEAHATYNTVDLDIDSIKRNLKSVAKKLRVEQENTKLALVVQLKDVLISTAREDRTQFYNIRIEEGEYISWKFGESGFITITKSDVDFIIKEINKYVQSVFDIEHNRCNNIDAAKTVEELQAISKAMTNGKPSNWS